MSDPEALARFAAGAGAYDAARQAIMDFATRVALAREERLRVELLVGELIANSLEHGDVPDGSSIELTLRLTPGALELHYTDAGRAFDPTALRPRDDGDPWRVGGWGWELIRNMCRAVSYTRRGHRNCLSLRIARNVAS